MQQEIDPEIFSSNKWVLIKEIAEKSQSPSDLAEKTKTSLSNIVQQLKLLEAYGIVKKEKAEPTNTNGKPKMIYSINKELAYIIYLKEGQAQKALFKIEPTLKGILNMIFASNEDNYFLSKFFFQNEDILKKCKSISLIKSTRDSIELFLITDHVDEIRAKFSNTFVQDLAGKTKKIVNWTHNEHEIEEGLHRKDKYFIDLIKNAVSIGPSEEVFKHIKESHGY